MAVKICHLTSAHRRYDVRIFEKECCSLASAGYDVTLIVNDDAPEEVTDKGVHIVSTGLLCKSKGERMTKGSRAVYELALKEGASVYHIHDPELIPYGLKLKGKGYNVIWDSHEEYMSLIDRKEYIPAPLRKFVGMAFRTYYKRALGKFDAVVAYTPDLEYSIKKYCRYVTTITNYPIIDPTEVAECDYHSKKLGFAGGIRHQWDTKEIIQAIDDDPDVRYVLMGPVIGENYFEELKAMPNWNQVDFLGMIPHAEVMGILRRCAVGMSILKPFGTTFGKRGTLGNTKLYEEMEAGLPVICTDFEIWKEMVDKYSCGIVVDPEDVQGIRDAIKKLVSDPELCRKMGQNGRRAVLEEYNWGTQEIVLLGLYDRVLGSK